ncbi:MAG: hypothetical protein E6614_13700 [Bradyrhizobium sp.]|uniref:Uncharacterized protein n=1 Tax=Bradyrhizobium denitrificans TaxID=2734912 RepID=A0ABS5G9M8_9BRAD|nr:MULTISPECIES: hypothetical protein [Bradyrhizobium]RTL96725.1 MAG: hypothetical protein EKK32_22275 [Bradyrhizobiaceae bacterium]MBR1138032.1 hypothetical protein [Bradyrhizobium denitrificans]MCL8483897.1 hypothetical protein [Bradyrhizobium denitrificans]MDU0958707.1 hypothetical protein [Bradyrhizobium sp.]MDU1493553.1 hypothetical protein [Bradyrhizobium sp.]
MSRRPAPPLRKPCPTCGRPLAVREGSGERCKLICPACDGPDPLHSPKALGWAKGSLRPPKRPQET